MQTALDSLRVSVAFSPEYIRLVLNENFEDAKALFLSPLIAIHYAHLVMLAETGIITRADARTLRSALDGIDLAKVRAARFDGGCEDLFFHLEQLIAAGCGADVAGRLHTARSRNDIDMTMYRMRLRQMVIDLAAATLALRASLMDVAAAHRETVFPAHTHTQPAQPTTIAHYLLGALEQLERDTTRLMAAYRSTNLNPLGACAITGTGFPIDRGRTSELLGFDAPTGNTYGSIATVDYLLESTSAASVLVVGVGRLVHDLLLWCTAEVGYLRLGDAFVQVSSIMPQKRNPVALEHARALASKAFAQLAAVPAAVHNTPFGDIVDTEDDLQPLVATAFKDATRAVALVAAAMTTAQFDVDRMRQRAAEGWVTVTELADTLARDHGVPFKAGHAIASALVSARAARPTVPLADLLASVSREVIGREIKIAPDGLARLLSPEHFIAIRKTLGGPAPEVTAAALVSARRRLADDTVEVGRRREALTSADIRRRQAVEAL